MTELDGSSDNEMSRFSASPPNETGSHPSGSTDLFATDFLGCTTCCSLSRDGLKEKTAGKLETQRYSIPFLESESTSSACPICYVLYEIVNTFVPPEDRVDTNAVIDPGIADFKVVLISLELDVAWFSIQFPLRRIITPYPELDSIVQLITGWLKQCEENHVQCQNGHRRRANLPARLVDVNAGDHDCVRLVDANEDEISFIALSYCWGRSAKLLTTTAKIGDYMRGIPWESLPKTFQDAITVTRALGFRYIWIDALCILQDSIEDWKAESTKMGHIYANASFVISADVAEESGEGFLSTRRDFDQIISLPDSSKTGNNAIPADQSSAHEIAVCPDPGHWGTDLIANQHNHYKTSYDFNDLWQNEDHTPGIERDPVFRRAWCLQERCLATRIIHFSSTEIIWECFTDTRCECGGLDGITSSSSRPTFVKRVQYQSLNEAQSWREKMSCWWSIVEDYSTRSLTFDSDRLVAISAIARHIRNRDLGTYLGGLWQKDLLTQLLWTISMQDTYGGSWPLLRRPETYIAPSWSWASYIGPIDRPSGLGEHETYVAEILNVECRHAGEDSYGQLLSGALQIKSSVLKATLRYEITEVDDLDRGYVYSKGNNGDEDKQQYLGDQEKDGNDNCEDGEYREDDYDHENHGADDFGSEQEEIDGHDPPPYARSDRKLLDPRISCGDKVLEQYTRIPVFPDRQAHEPENVLCLFITHRKPNGGRPMATGSLILIPSKTSPDAFERIGVATLWLEDDSRCQAETQTLTVV